MVAGAGEVGSTDFAFHVGNSITLWTANRYAFGFFTGSLSRQGYGALILYWWRFFIGAVIGYYFDLSDEG